MITKPKLPIFEYAAFLIISVLFMLAFSLWTSPAYRNWYGCDASFFTLVGRGMLNGRIPYRDYYDLKGPYFFFIQALGQLIGKGHTGIFILQIISLFISLILIYSIGRLFISGRKTIGVIVFFLLAHISMLWGGNCLEEFTLPLNLLVMYMHLVIFRKLYCTQTEPDKPDEALITNSDTSSFTIPTADNCTSPDDTPITDNSMVPDISALLAGICFTVTAFSKITAGAPIIGTVIGAVILLLIHRHFKELGFYLLYFTFGAMLALFPLLIYYGHYGAVLKMLYCTFVFGFKRSSDLSHILSPELEAKLAGVLFSIVFLLVHYPWNTLHKKAGNTMDEKASTPSETVIIDKDIVILLLPASVITYIALHLGDSFIYYFITGMPCLLTSLILFVKIYDPLILFKNVRQSICWVLLFVFAFHYAGDSVDTVNTFINRPDSEFHKNYYNNSLNMGALIPEFDRNSVFSFDIDMQWYEINDILPCNRYVVNLQYFIALEPSIEDELKEFLNETPPKWIITSNTLQDYLPVMDAIVKEKYDCLYQTDVGLVYLLR